ncbi:VOC family protein [Lysobacter tyrosinilyticus]
MKHESAPPFEVLRVNHDSVLDLLAEVPTDAMHVALSVDRRTFERVRERLQASGVVFGGAPFVRDGEVARQFGARGWADALYFHDPDRHNIEVRIHEP